MGSTLYLKHDVIGHLNTHVFHKAQQKWLEYMILNIKLFAESVGVWLSAREYAKHSIVKSWGQPPQEHKK